MNAMTLGKSFLVFGAFALVLAGCGGGGGKKKASTEGLEEPNSQADMALSAFDREALQGGTFGLTALAEATVEVDGEVFVVNQTSGESQAYVIGMVVDVTNFALTSDIAVPLVPGNAYEIYLLLEIGGRQYASAIVDPPFLAQEEINNIKGVMHPVVGDRLPDAESIQQAIKFEFDPVNDVNLAEFSDPSIGVTISGGEEVLFQINTGLDAEFQDQTLTVWVYLEPGSYDFEFSFYDGSLLITYIPFADFAYPDDEGSEPAEATLEVSSNYSFDQTTCEAAGALDVPCFIIVVPGKAVREAGGPDNVEAVFSIVGSWLDGFGPWASRTLTLNPSGLNYRADVFDIPGLKAADVTWALYLTEISSGRVFAYCAETIPLVGAGDTLTCDLNFISLSIVSADEPVAFVPIEVTDSQDEPIGGVVISVIDEAGNEVPIGITDEFGTLSTFVDEGTVVIVATIPTEGDATPPTGDSGEVILEPGDNDPVPVVVDTTAPGIQILSPADGDIYNALEAASLKLEFKSSESGSAEINVNGTIWTVENVIADQLVSEPIDALLVEGANWLTVTAFDEAGNPNELPVLNFTVHFTVEPPIVLYSIPLEARYYRRPTRREDAYEPIGRLTVVIPSRESIDVRWGNSDRYLLFLWLGNVKCVYLGGKFNATLGGVELEDFEWLERFKSPVCSHGRYVEGQSITIEGSIGARVIFGDPNWPNEDPEVPDSPNTRIAVSVDVVDDSPPPDDGGLADGP